MTQRAMHQLGGVISKRLSRCHLFNCSTISGSCGQNLADALSRPLCILATRSIGEACDLAKCPETLQQVDRIDFAAATPSCLTVISQSRQNVSGSSFAQLSSRRGISGSAASRDSSIDPNKRQESGSDSSDQELASEVKRRLKTVEELHAEGGKKFGRKLRYPQPQNPSYIPWTPTNQLVKRKFLPRRMGFLLQELEKEEVEKARNAKKLPDFGPGHLLEVQLEIPENKGRPATFKGIVIAKRNRGIRTSFTLRNHLGTVGAVERTFPLFSPTVKSIKVLDRRRVRRAKLYYLRDRNPKEYRVA